MGEIIDEFQEKHPSGTVEDRVEFCHSEYAGEGRLEEASNRSVVLVEKIRRDMQNIDEERCQEYVEDLVLCQTSHGFDTQEAIPSELTELHARD